MRKIKKAMLFGLLAASLLFQAAHAIAQTNVSGTISTNTTWTLAGSPYIVTGDVYVQASSGNPVLTIQSGVTVKFNAGTTLWIGYNYPGGLQAVGTSGSPITFTANTGSPGAGYWRGIYFAANTVTGSQIVYATVAYGGQTSVRGAIHVVSCSPSISNVTAQNNAYAGISVAGGSPTISGSTLTTNPWGLMASGTGSPSVSSTTVSTNTTGGINLTSPISASLQTVTVSNNTGYAISEDAGTTLGTVSALTATGNTTNGIEVRGSTASVATTWKSVGIPFVATGDVYVQNVSTTVLTIAAGVTVKFNANTSLWIGYNYAGGLSAVGTSGSPITFTANTGSPTAGYWRGIYLGQSATSSSQIAYATVAYGGQSGSRGGIHITSCSPSISNVTAQNNAYAGISVATGSPTITSSTLTTNPWGLLLTGSGTPTVQFSTFSSNTSGGVSINGPTLTVFSCSFTGNAVGITNSLPTTPVTAQFNFWNTVDGPSGSGFGTGQSISTGVTFEPWLTAAPSTPEYFNTYSFRNKTFNPTIGINNHVTLTAVQTGNWSALFINSGGTTVRTITGSGTSAAVTWDGKNDSGVAQPDGNYTYEFHITSAGGTATPARGRSIVNSALQLTVNGIAAAPLFFSPNADGVQDTTTLTGTVTFDSASWTINVKNSSNTVVRSVPGTSIAISYAWDGKNGSGVVQPDGVYTFVVALTDDSANTNSSPVSVTLDDTVPVAAISAPAAGATLSNIYTAGATNVAVNGTGTDTNISNWTLDYGAGTSPPYWTTLATGTTGFTALQIATWATAPLTNGTFTLRLQVWDKAGNRGLASQTEIIGNFSASENVQQFNSTTGGTAVYTSIVPFTLNENLFIKNVAGQVVRTLVNASRPGGTYTDTWDGKNDSGVLVPDGGYSYYATLTAGTYSYTWDLTNQYVGTGTSGLEQAYNTWDPFNNQPLVVPYTVPWPARVYIAIGPSFDANNVCSPGFCVIYGAYQQSGTHTIYWAGVDPTGTFRPDFNKIGIVASNAVFSKNAVVVYGTAIGISNVTATPPAFSPYLGSQTIAFDLATYQSTANITIKFLSQQSLSVLRTISLNSVAAGHTTASWDGRADSGVWVSPGSYTITVSGSDSRGNVATGQILCTVQY